MLTINAGLVRGQYRASVPELANVWRCSPDDLQQPDQYAVKVAFWFCERFNWPYVSEASLTNLQRRILRHI
jgi:hypothetical protein